MKILGNFQYWINFLVSYKKYVYRFEGVQSKTFDDHDVIGLNPCATKPVKNSEQEKVEAVRVERIPENNPLDTYNFTTNNTTR